MALLVGLGLQIAGSRFADKADMFMGGRYTAETALLSGVLDHEALLQVFDIEPVILQQSDRMRRSHLSVFALPWSDWLGASIHEKSSIADPGRCAGWIADTERVVSDNSIYIRASGWAWDLVSGRALRNIVLVDQNDKVIGFGRGPYFDRKTTRTMTDSVAVHRAVWRGHGNIEKPTTVSAFALIDDGKLICRLSGEALIDTSDLSVSPQLTYVWSPKPPVGVKISGGAALNRALTLGKGWSGVEDQGVWTDGEYAEVAFDTEGLPDRVQIAILGDMIIPSGGSQQVRILDQFGSELAAGRSTSPNNIALVFDLDRKNYPRIMTIRFEIESPVRPPGRGTNANMRQLGFLLRSWTIEGLP